MLWLPTARLAVLQVAVLVLALPAGSATAPQPVIVTPPQGTNVRLYGDESPLGAPSFGDKVKLVIFRDAKRTSVRVTLGRQPTSPQG